MKKGFILILLLIIISGIFIASCERGSVSYCPYCSSPDIKETDKGVYKCGKCGKTFGAKEITGLIRSNILKPYPFARGDKISRGSPFNVFFPAWLKSGTQNFFCS